MMHACLHSYAFKPGMRRPQAGMCLIAFVQEVSVCVVCACVYVCCVCACVSVYPPQAINNYIYVK